MEGGAEPRSMDRLVRAFSASAQAVDMRGLEELLDTAEALGALPLNYDAYCTARDSAPPRVRKYLTASLFARLPRALDDTIVPLALLRYVRDTMVMRYAHSRLAACAAVGDGCIREHELEHYVFSSIPSVPELAGLSESFYPFYVFTAVRAFIFFLDPHRTGRIPLRELIASTVFAQWLRVLPMGHAELGPMGGALPLRRGEGQQPRAATAGADAPTWSPSVRALVSQLMPAPPDNNNVNANSSNWFSAAHALRVYSAYLSLDCDQNGMLAPSELAGYAGGTYTSAFVARMFEESHTYDTGVFDADSGVQGVEIDYKAFLDLVLASENRSSLPSLRFFFTLLDVRHQGWIGLFEIRAFYAHVQERLRLMGHEPVDAANVGDEIFDMVAPREAGRITLDDLRRCKVGATVCEILLDAAGFIAYDRREELKGGGGGGSGGGHGSDSVDGSALWGDDPHT